MATKAADVLLVTTEHVPGREVEVIGLIFTNRATFPGSAWRGLRKRAAAVGADAVVGCRLPASFLGASAYGTAVRFKGA